ncbi:hypothetical protein WJX81_004332 [Elliptochloris bilobata]|uniref:Chromatin modification-related protein MEAF6 n=1 Tax=Elliptochloris bilobata TaxID=381761 RepID=A0AAW1S439_9CHLO
MAEDLRTVEKQIYDLETRYVATANPQGNALKGYEGFLSHSSAPARRGPVKPEERLFSSSSVTGASHLPA